MTLKEQGFEAINAAQLATLVRDSQRAKGRSQRALVVLIVDDRQSCREVHFNEAMLSAPTGNNGAGQGVGHPVRIAPSGR
jgi:hypothetical protein